MSPHEQQTWFSNVVSTWAAHGSINRSINLERSVPEWQIDLSRLGAAAAEEARDRHKSSRSNHSTHSSNTNMVSPSLGSRKRIKKFVKEKNTKVAEFATLHKSWALPLLHPPAEAAASVELHMHYSSQYDLGCCPQKNTYLCNKMCCRGQDEKNLWLVSGFFVFPFSLRKTPTAISTWDLMLGYFKCVKRIRGAKMELIRLTWSSQPENVFQHALVAIKLPHSGICMHEGLRKCTPVLKYCEVLMAIVSFSIRARRGSR